MRHVCCVVVVLLLCWVLCWCCLSLPGAVEFGLLFQEAKELGGAMACVAVCIAITFWTFCMKGFPVRLRRSSLDFWDGPEGEPRRSLVPFGVWVVKGLVEGAVC